AEGGVTMRRVIRKAPPGSIYVYYGTSYRGHALAVIALVVAAIMVGLGLVIGFIRGAPRSIHGGGRMLHETGIILKPDDLGRIVMPKKIRRELGIDSGQRVEQIGRASGRERVETSVGAGGRKIQHKRRAQGVPKKRTISR